MAGNYSTFEDNKDLELVELVTSMCNTPIGTEWVEPPCVMDLVLGDTLLKLARIKFKGITDRPSSPVLLSPTRTWGLRKNGPQSETIYATADIILKMHIE